jgi:Secretion system C-terminal sorting domain
LIRIEQVLRKQRNPTMKQTTHIKGQYLPVCFSLKLKSVFIAIKGQVQQNTTVPVNPKLKVMKTFLPFSKSVISRYFLLIVFCLITGIISAQTTGANLLGTPGFENPALPVINGNNRLGIGVTYAGWSCTNGGFNIIHVDGTGYDNGQDTAANGVQYVDVSSSDGYISRTFTLTAPSFIYFSGSFGTRDSGKLTYVNWTGIINILNSSNTVVASSNSKNFTNTTSKRAWYTLAGSSTLLPAGVYTYRAYIGNFGHFDNASARTGGVPLPVKLENFTATARDKNVILNWVINEEINFSHYVIEKSLDGKNYTEAGMVLADGNTKDKKNYTFSDVINTNQENIIYYRLRLVDIDGKSTYSNTRIIKTGKQSENNISIVTYPNPVSNELRITIPANWQNKNATYDVINSNGQVSKRIETSSSSQTETVNVSNLAPGFYFVRVKCNGETAQQKIIKQ